MFNFPRRPALTRAGIGAVLVALVAIAGYNIGLAQSPSAVVSAAQSAVRTVDTPHLKGSDTTTSYAPVVDAVAPAVVTVRVEKKASVVPTQFPDDDDLFRFFGRQFQLPRQQRVPRQSGLGSGVITTTDGYILTNNHVIDGADQVRVELPDQRVFDAKVIGADPASDLAVLKIDAANLPIVSIGDSNKVRVGDVVLAVGNPLGVGQTVTMGIVSAKGRATPTRGDSFEDFIQTDAPINQGNSGGPLVSTGGQLIGINSQILTPSGGNIGIGFAIPANMAKNVMTQLIDHGQVHRGMIGVTIQPVTSDIANSLGLPQVRGALVNSVTAGSPADKAGIRRGDVITAVNGAAIKDSNDLRNDVAQMAPGSAAKLTVLRDGKEQSLNVTLAEREAADAERGEEVGPNSDRS